MDEQALATAIAETQEFWLEQEARECREDRAFEEKRYEGRDYRSVEERGRVLGELVEVSDA